MARRICVGCRPGCCEDSKRGELRAIKCAECDGLGCQECHDGKFYLSGCAHDQVDGMQRFAQFARLYEQGALPVAGGIVDQAWSFVDAVDYWLRDMSVAREGVDG